MHHLAASNQQTILRFSSWAIAVLISVCAGCTNLQLKVTLVGPRQQETSAFAEPMFEDADILAEFDVTPDNVAFILTNKTRETIRIPWDDVAFVSIEGKANSVTHRERFPDEGEVDVDELLNRNLPQAPTIVPPSSKVSDTIVPWSHIREGEVLQAGILPIECGPLRCTMPKDILGKTVGLHMPLEIEGARRSYDFKFRIDEVSY